MTLEQFLEKRDEICARAEGWLIGQPETGSPSYCQKTKYDKDTCLGEGETDYSKPENWTRLREKAITRDHYCYSKLLAELTDPESPAIATPNQMCYASVMVLARQQIGS